MTWLILEGLDRSGKSSVANLYKSKGYEYVHFLAPEKKFTEPGYAGPSYVDEILDIYMKFDGKDVLFDRSIYGELIWPAVYGRKPQIDDDDLEILKEFEDRNQADRILMIDPDKSAHWKRCVDNNEPLTLKNFTIASRLYEKLAHDHNFIPRQLGDYDKSILDQRKSERTDKQGDEESKLALDKKVQDKVHVVHDAPVDTQKVDSVKEASNEREFKLEKANAIKSILSKKIVKQKGEIYESLENDIRSFLDKQLETIFGSNSVESLTNEEIQILKVFCTRLQEKQGAKK